MSDEGRKDFSTKAKESMTPDSSKSTQQKVKETVTDTTDRVARGMQPDDQKSAGQSAFDKGERSKDEHVHGGTGETMYIPTSSKSLLVYSLTSIIYSGDKVKGALGMDKH
ncbi:MAG: hypothetical protein M1834_008730 [Cirrosporium novae-zelandiae]|nr:MAG: hypothetical protein M1834_008730 [Cirrosporium novae-zelandiae]